MIEIEAAYAKCGWTVKFFTETAVSNYDGEANFFTDDEDAKEEWGAGIVGSNKNLKQGVKNKVKVVRLANFILEKVGKRKISGGKKKPTVLMKMDIEGSEIEVRFLDHTYRQTNNDI